MKKILSIALCVIVLVALSSLVAPSASETTKVSAATAKEVATNPLETRFLNMLNRNFVYNGDFDSADTIINNASLRVAGTS